MALLKAINTLDNIDNILDNIDNSLLFFFFFLMEEKCLQVPIHGCKNSKNTTTESFGYLMVHQHLS